MFDKIIMIFVFTIQTFISFSLSTLTVSFWIFVFSLRSFCSIIELLFILFSDLLKSAFLNYLGGNQFAFGKSFLFVKFVSHNLI